MRAITITLLMFVLLSACASGDAPQGGLGPPYNVPADPEQTPTGQPTQEGCIRVFCDKYPEYAFDPKYCCIGGYGKGDKD